MRRAVVMSFLLVVLVVANATAETQKLNFTDFDEVAVGYGMHVLITQGEAYRVEVTGASEDLKRLEVKHDGGRLKFSMKSGWARWFSSGRIRIDITLPELQRLDLSGGSQGSVSMQIGSKPFASDLSGGSSLTGQLGCGNVELNLSGGSTARLSGTGNRLKLNGSGGSKYELKNFAVSNVRADLSGGSQVTVGLNGELNAALSGGSNVVYYGNVTLGSVAASGGSKVRQGL